MIEMLPRAACVLNDRGFLAHMLMRNIRIERTSSIIFSTRLKRDWARTLARCWRATGSQDGLPQRIVPKLVAGGVSGNRRDHTRARQLLHEQVSQAGSPSNTTAASK